jgi:hypothetical protein
MSDTSTISATLKSLQQTIRTQAETIRIQQETIDYQHETNERCIRSFRSMTAHCPSESC